MGGKHRGKRRDEKLSDLERKPTGRHRSNVTRLGGKDRENGQKDDRKGKK